MRKRRIEFIIAGILATFGGAMLIVGMAMGGRPGSFNNVDGRLVYLNSRERIVVSDTPFWLSRIDSLSILGFGPGSFNPLEEPLNFGREREDNEGEGDEQRTDQKSGKASIFNGSTQTLTSGDTLDIGGYDKFEIDVDYGYVTIESGNSPELRVEGELSVNVSTDDGTLKIESEYDGKGITKKIIGDVTHYFKDGEDITSKFTVILPDRFYELDVNLGAGAMEISSLTIQNFSVDAEMGSIEINDVTAHTTEIDVEMGSVKVTGHSTNSAQLDCDLGSIKFSGHIDNNMTAACSFGSIDATVSWPESYGYNVSNNLGSIILDGKSFSTGSRDEHNDSGLTFDLKCDLGSIVVKFDDNLI